MGTYSCPRIAGFYLSQMLPPRPPWRNRLARSAVNRKVGGSSPPGGACFFFHTEGKNIDPGRTRTCNPLIRSQMPYPLGHRASLPPVPRFVYLYSFFAGQIYRQHISQISSIAVIAQLGER